MTGYARATTVIAGAVVALALTSCSDDAGTEPGTTARPSSSATSSPSSTAAPSTTSATTSTASVTVPAAARAHTEEGAKAFAKFFVDALNSSQVSADPAVLSAISGPECKGCKVYVDSAESMRAKGHHADKPSMKLSGVIVRPDSSEFLMQLDLLIDESASQTVDRNGKAVESFDGGKLTIRTSLRPTRASWVVEQALLVS